MDSKKQLFQTFLDERSGILEDIRSFLDAVLSFCVNQEDKWDLKPDTTGIKKAPSLIQSLYQIHGLYGYPANTDINTEVNKCAVRDMLHEIEQENEKKEKRTLLHYCREAANDKFWQFEFSDGTSSQESLLRDTVLREPAHIFLQMVRDLLRNSKTASKIGQLALEKLPDGNHLKPVVWAEVAEHKNKPACFGVSLGVRSFVRPLYLGIKLSQLRKNGNNDVKLEDVNAFQSMDRSNKDPKDYDPEAKSKYKKSKDETNLKDEIKPPCPSCQIFFSEGFKRKNETKFTLFGNCAEYDVIRTANSDDKLGKIKETNNWKNFEKACEEHLKARNELTKKLKEPGNLSQDKIMETYYAETRTTKVLKYKWNSLNEDYELQSKDRSHGKTKNRKMIEDNKKTKRMKTTQ